MLRQYLKFLFAEKKMKTRNQRLLGTRSTKIATTDRLDNKRSFQNRDSSKGLGFYTGSCRQSIRKTLMCLEFIKPPCH
jgi:hypothetical protein